MLILMDLITPSFIIYACFVMAILTPWLNRVSYKLCTRTLGVFGVLIFALQFILSGVDGLSLIFSLMCT
ncbi:MAG: hypothetical protein KC478_01110, partial [Bacteriovoracaceae bacterium]|nr:hypothetical protein [Bacteriovoracaceae bacterium]